MPQLYSNNSIGRLLAGINSSVTTLQLESGQGASFASPGGGDYQMITLCDDLETVFEIVRVDQRVTDTFTIVRAQEGTTARTWGAGTRVYASLTAALIPKLGRKDETQTISAVWNFAVAPTISGNVVWHAGNDGHGSGLNADMLDNNEGSHYLNASNINAGTLAVARGGTGLSSVTANNYVRVNATATAFEMRTVSQVLGDIGAAAATVSLTAGVGLTGGGTLSADRTFALGTPSSITTTSTNNVSGTTHSHALNQTVTIASDVTLASQYPADMFSFGTMSTSSATGGLATHVTVRSSADTRVLQFVSSLSGGSSTPSLWFRTSHTTDGGGGWTSYVPVANDANVVHKTGDEDIGGNKTFTAALRLTGGITLPVSATDWRIQISSLAGSDNASIRLVSGGAMLANRGAFLELNGANASAVAAGWRLMGIGDSVLQSTNSVTVTTNAMTVSGSLTVSGVFTSSTTSTFNGVSTFNATPVMNHTSGVGLTVNRTNASTISAIQYQHTAGSIYAGNVSGSFVIGSAADLSNATNTWMSANATGLYVVTSGVSNAVWHAGNFVPANKADYSTTLTFKGSVPGSANLDSYTATGILHQNTNADASTGTNYPIALAGMLEVFASGSYVYQTYTAHQNGSMYRRGWYTSSWSPWRTIWDSGNLNPADYVDRTSNQTIGGNKSFTGQTSMDFGAGAQTSSHTLLISNGASYRIGVYPRLAAGTWNTNVAANDTGLVFTAGSSDTGRLFIGPWGTTGGIAISPTVVTLYGSYLQTQGNISVARLGAPAGALDVLAATDTRVLMRTESTQGTIDSVNAANSAYRPLWMRASSFQLNGGNLSVASGSVSASTDVLAGASVQGTTYVSVGVGDGRGFRFWGTATDYQIYMSSIGAVGAGRVSGDTTSDYNMYFRMTSGTNRGFVFQNGTTNVAGIDASGNVRGNYTYMVRSYTTDWFRSTGATGWYNETYGGGIYMTDATYVRVFNGKSLSVDPGELHFGSSTRQMVNLWSTTFGIGIQNSTLYYRTGAGGGFAWFVGGVHSNTQNDPGSGGTLRGRLDTDGNWYGTDFYATSDATLKDEVKPGIYTGRLIPRSWTWAKGTAKAGQRDNGFLAQEVEEHYPWMVNVDIYGKKSVAYHKATAVLAYQLYNIEDRLDREIEDVKARLTILESK